MPSEPPDGELGMIVYLHICAMYAYRHYVIFSHRVPLNSRYAASGTLLIVFGIFLIRRILLLVLNTPVCVCLERGQAVVVVIVVTLGVLYALVAGRGCKLFSETCCGSTKL